MSSVLSDRRYHYPNRPQTSKSRSHRDQLLDPVRQRPLAHPRLVAPGLPNSAVLLLPVVRRVLRATVMIGHTSPAGSHSVISVMSPLTAGVMIIALPGLLRRAHSGLGMAIDHGIGRQSDLIAASADVHGHPALLARPMRATGGIEALVRDLGVTTKGKQTSQCLVGHYETSRRCRFLCWKRSTGKFAHIASLLAPSLISREGTSSSMWRMPFATVACG